MISKFNDYKLGDFGVSKVMSHTTGATMTGTEGYMAPEVLHIEKYGKEVDIYSLGIVMYWLLNNRRMPFIGADEKVTLVNANQAAMRRYHGEKIPAPKNGSDELKKIVLKACEYKPKDRYLTAQEMYDALEELGSGKSYTKNTVSGYQEEPSSEDDWMESGETVGKTVDDLSGRQTEGNSWGGGGTIGGTIGKLKGNTEKKQKEVQEEPKTIGVKKAYQEQKKKVEEAKKVAAEKKKKAKKEVTAQTYQKRLKKTVFGYLWEIFVLGLCVVFLFRTIQIGTFKENPIAILAVIAGIAIPEALDFIMESTIDLWKFCVDGWALSSIYILIVYYLLDKNFPTDLSGVFIFALVFVVFYFGGKIVNKFTYVLVNEPVEKSDSKSEKIPDFVKDEDLYKTIQIKESEIGTTVNLLVNYPYPDRQKKKLEVYIPENVSDGTILRLKGLGKTKDGNLLLHLEISKSGENMPTTIEKKSFFGKVKDLFK